MSNVRTRQQRRKADRSTSRAPGLLRGVRPLDDGEPLERAEHGVRNQYGLSWRLVSAMIFLALGGVLVFFFSAEAFYVRSIVVAGTNYLDESEVFRFADIAETHIFWVNPSEVRQNLLDESPVIADARVQISWPPNMVRIIVEERQPALIWVQSGITALVDLQGRVLRYPPEGEPLPSLLPVLTDGSMTGPPGVETAIPQEAINGALQLQTLLAGLPELRYNAEKGLGFREPGGWDVWLGVGTDMDDKLLIYDALQQQLAARGQVPYEVNIANVDAVYYCLNINGCQ